MKNLLITLSALIILFTSCTKIIDIELEEGGVKTVIEANLYEGAQTFVVKVTNTSNFFGDNTPKAITNATVTINGSLLTNNGDGTYMLPTIIGVASTEYTLIVSENGNTFEAKATIPSLIPIDSITYEFFPESPFSDSGYVSTIVVNDPAGINNFYRIQVDKGGEFFGGINDLILLDDGFLDGNQIEFPLFGIGVAQAGDTISMDLLSCDNATYTYLEGVDALINGGNGAPPANPKSNFSNGALGNFNVYSKSSKSIVIIP